MTGTSSLEPSEPMVAQGLEASGRGETEILAAETSCIEVFAAETSCLEVFYFSNFPKRIKRHIDL